MENETKMVGGPGGDVSIETPPVTEEVVETPIEPLHKGFTGHIKTPEELKTYTEQLEAQIVSMRSTPSAPTAPPVYTPIPVQEDELEKVWYSDPKRAKELIRQDVLGELQRRDEVKTAEVKFWEEFYGENGDLKGLEKIVKSVVNEKRVELKDAPLSRAKEIIAKEARSIVGEVKRGLGVTETELPSGSAVALRSTGSPTPKLPEPPKQPRSFTDQVLKFRSKRRS